jgi:DAACS family dicarboxylate/amino acid:cation (Na+ or H+) symporter
MKIHVAIALGLVAGLAFGLLAAATESDVLHQIAVGVAPLGTAFMNLLKMVVIPLVASTLFVGVAGMRNLKQLGRLGGLTLTFFAVTTFVSIVIGMIAMRLLLPFTNEEAARAIAAGVTTPAAALPNPVDFFIGLIPDNPFAAAADGALLPLVIFTCFVAAATGTLEAEHRDRLIGLGESMVRAFVQLVHWVLWTAPIGVFALAAPVTAQAGWAVLQSLAVFVVAVILGLVTFVLFIYVPAIKFMSAAGVREFFAASTDALLIAFATTSQAATVPAMLDATERLRIRGYTAGFVVGLGAAIGRAGSALFQGAGLIFLAWLYDVPLPAQGLGVAILATAAVSITVAGVPSASVISLAPALGAVGVPLEGLGVLLGVDRIPDMFRTATNATGTIAAACVTDPMIPSRRSSRPVNRPSGGVET